MTVAIGAGVNLEPTSGALSASIRISLPSVARSTSA